MGVNGSGKGTKGLILRNLAEGLGVYRIVMSELIDRHIKNNTPLGLIFNAQKKTKESGGLLLNPQIFEAIEQEILAIYASYELSGYGGECKIILDGYPRVEKIEDTEQLERFLSYGIPYIVFNLVIDKNTCLHRVNVRAITEGERGDEASAPERFDKLSLGNEEILRVMRALNPHNIIQIDGGVLILEQIMRILKKCFGPGDIMKMIKHLDNPQHEARKIIDKAERKKLLHGGATAHSVPRGMTEHNSTPASGSDALSLFTT
jgi:adenylate kinase family enzyme